MTNFLDLPREIRDMIYLEVLYYGRRLFAKNEQLELCNPNDLDWRLLPDANPALFRASKQIYPEASSVFFDRNTFQPSYYPALGKPSLFTIHARRFRNINLVLGFDTRYTKNDPMKLWKGQMHMLAFMVNLRFLELSIFAFARLSERRNLGWQRVAFDMAIAGRISATCDLVAELLTPVPQSVRKMEGIQTRGIFIVGPFRDQESSHERPWIIHELGEACREFGVNFMMIGKKAITPEPAQVHYWARLLASKKSSLKVRKFYYG